MSSMNIAPAFLICLANAMVFSRLLLGACLTGDTKTRKRNAFQPCLSMTAYSVLSWPSSR